MRIRFLATPVAFLLLVGTAFAGDLTVIRSDAANWPQARVVVAVPEADASAEDYALTLPSGKTVAAKRVTELSDEPRPASMVVALDTSRSLSPRHLEAAKESLARYVDRLQGNEQLSLLAFNDSVELVTGFTPDRDACKSTLSQLQLGGQHTELYRAMLYGIENLKNLPGQRTLLVITDGKDEGSAVTIEQVIRAARASGVRVLAIGLPVLPGKESETYLPKLERIATETGGAYRVAGTSDELGEATYNLMVENQGLATHVYELEFDMSDAGALTPGRVDARLNHREGNAMQSAILPLTVVQGGSTAIADGSFTPGLMASAENDVTRTPEQLTRDESGRAAGATAIGDSKPEVSPVTSQTTAAASRPEPAAQPVPRDSVNHARVWPWVVLGILALLLLLYLLRRKKTDEPPAGTEESPLIIEFPDLGLSYPLRPGTMIMGSGPASDILLDDPLIADAHVEFCTGADCGLRKLPGSHGVLLNGEEVERTVKLKPGDTLMFGTTRAVIKRSTILNTI